MILILPAVAVVHNHILGLGPTGVYSLARHLPLTAPSFFPTAASDAPLLVSEHPGFAGSPSFDS
jgi:hypothetical protein